MLKKKTFIFGLLLFFFMILPCRSEDICQRANLNFLKKHLPGFKLKDTKIVFKKKEKGLCEIILDYKGQKYPMFIGNDFVILGNMYSHKKNLTNLAFKEAVKREQVELAKLFKKLKDKINKVVVFTYRPSTKSKKELYMFTDPLCPFSHKAEKNIKNIVKKCNTTLKVVFFPVHLPMGKKLAVESICKKMSFEEYIKDGWRKEPPERFQCPKGKKILANSIMLGKKLQIQGVPTFILPDGTRIVGVNLKKIEEVLKRKK